MKPADAIVTMVLVVAVTLAPARPAQAATAAAPSCLQKAARKLTAAFAALERTGACETTNDAVATMTRVDTSISELLNLLGDPGPGQCRLQILTAMGIAGLRFGRGGLVGNRLGFTDQSWLPAS